jgi:hypothetical protein
MLYDVFLEIDTKGLGVIHPKQLEKALSRCGLNASRGAIRSMLVNMGKDPDGTINARDFVAFFRKAEALTEEDMGGGPVHGCTHCIILIVLAAVIALFVFLIIFLGADQVREREGALIGMVSSGLLLLGGLFIVLCKPMWHMKAAPIVNRKAAALVKHMAEADLSERQLPLPNVAKSKQWEDRPLHVEDFDSEFHLPESCRHVSFDPAEDFERDFDRNAPIEQLRLGDDDWGEPQAPNTWVTLEPSAPPQAVVCRVPNRGTALAPHNKAVDRHAPQQEFRYDPAAYTEAAMMNQAQAADLQVPGSFSALSPARRDEPTVLPRACPAPLRRGQVLEKKCPTSAGSSSAALPTAPFAQYGSYRSGSQPQRFLNK